MGHAGRSECCVTVLCEVRSNEIVSSRLRNWTHWPLSPAVPRVQRIRCGAITFRNSLELMIFVFFQNFGKCRWFLVTR
jgi:hypothetical protein